MAGQIDVEKNIESKGLEKTLTFDDDPSLNPQNFSQARKILILSIAVLLTTSSTCGTSLASGGAKATLRDFGLPEAYGWEVLPVSIYLVGYFIGNTALAPLSENYGRRPVNLLTIVFYMTWMMACALAPNWAAFNVFRLLNGFFSAGAPATVSGICADLYSDDMRRGRALLWYNMATTLGSTLGPLISGFAVFDNWRLTILDKRAKKIRKTEETDLPRGPHEDDTFIWQHLLTKVLIRPVRMLCREPLVLGSCLYLAFQYSILYIYLQSYSIIFQDIYGFNTGEKGLAFIPIAVGTLSAFPVNILIEHVYLNACSQDSSWTKHHGARRLPAACISGPLIVTSLFWSAWTSRPSIHRSSSVLSGVLYGLGYTLNFNALLNYLVDGYASYASSANAASSLTRQIMGAALPFAAVPMYDALGVGWASSLLGFVAAIMSIIPFLFWMYGEKLLEKSILAQELAREKERECR
ncbi:MFS general substrate transporter [Aureobasidium pullulans]|uniref:MFS general substrate transporter n=1 Tax=Aureobasidium pullulans TaxID=5580 RepID=A0A4S9WYT9_AURPU|nr:MFS general substrate transporter [Aureobasidium pullulans]